MRNSLENSCYRFKSTFEGNSFSYDSLPMKIYHDELLMEYKKFTLNPVKKINNSIISAETFLATSMIALKFLNDYHSSEKHYNEDFNFESVYLSKGLKILFDNKYISKENYLFISAISQKVTQYRKGKVSSYSMSSFFVKNITNDILENHLELMIKVNKLFIQEVNDGMYHYLNKVSEYDVQF